MEFKRQKRKQRHRRIRSKIKGVKNCPRFCVFRSNFYIYTQLIDDEQAKTLVSFSDLNLDKKQKQTKTERAKIVGQEIAKKAKKQKIKKVVFDRGGYKFHGRVKALAEGAREGGLEF